MSSFFSTSRLCVLSVAVLACLLSTSAAVDWTGAGAGNEWTTPANWSTGTVPSASDNAVISSAGPVAYSSGNSSVMSIQLNGPDMEMSGGSLTVYGNEEVNVSNGAMFTLSGGTITLDPNVAHSDSFDWNVGHVSTGTFTMTDGSFVHHSDDFKVGDKSGGNGIVNMTGGNMYVADGMSVSESGTANVTFGGTALVVFGNSAGFQQAGGHEAMGYLSIANNTGGVGTLKVNGDATAYTRKLEGRDGTGTINVSGNGRIIVMNNHSGDGNPPHSVLGQGGSGVYQTRIVDNGKILFDSPNGTAQNVGMQFGTECSTSDLTIGNGGDALLAARRLITFGGMSAGCDMADFPVVFPELGVIDYGNAGNNPQGTSNIAIHDGGKILAGMLYIGNSGTANVTQDGGSVVAVNDDADFAANGLEPGLGSESLFLGQTMMSQCDYDLSGGTIHAGDKVVVGHYGTGALEISGDAAVVADRMIVGANPGSVGTVELSGGSIDATSFTRGVGSTTFTWTDGTLAVEEFGDAAQAWDLFNSNAGTFSPKPGGRVYGAYTQGSGASMNLAVASDASEVTVDGVLSLDGTLTLEATDFDPEDGATISLISGILRTGTFDDVSVPTGCDVDLLYSTAGVSIKINSWTAVAGGLVGDLDGNGFVGSSDLDIVRANWGQTVSAGDLSQGDADGDGQVTSADLDVVRANWGNAAAASAVPEPCCLTLLAVLVGMGLIRRRTNR